MRDHPPCTVHSTVILGEDHDTNKKRSWWVIALCGTMMIVEIGGGLAFGSIALVADGLHMSTHAGALLLATLAYSFASRHATDPHFTFGLGKLGDLAGFSSAIVLAMVALLIGYESVIRFLVPVPINFAEAIPIAVVGLIVNIASVLLLSSSHHHGHGHSSHSHDGEKIIEFGRRKLALSIFENGVPPRFRVRFDGAAPEDLTIQTVRPDGGVQLFQMTSRGAYFESVAEVAEPHAFQAIVRFEESGALAHESTLTFEEHLLGNHATDRDNNMRAAIIHVMADAAVSVLVIAGLVMVRLFGWLWVDPIAGIMGAIVIATWSYGLIRDTGAILLDKIPDKTMAQKLRAAVESEGDDLTDFHLWRLGPGHLGAIMSIITTQNHGANYYHDKLARFSSLSHLTVEVQSPAEMRYGQ
jgi:cation diffusion facilitator family transporter